MLNAAGKYREDANFVDDLVTEFSATSKQLMNSIQNILAAIDGVANAANEGAIGITNIANRAAEVKNRSQRTSFED
jgi:hypothetical protein